MAGLTASTSTGPAPRRNLSPAAPGERDGGRPGDPPTRRASIACPGGPAAGARRKVVPAHGAGRPVRPGREPEAILRGAGRRLGHPGQAGKGVEEAKTLLGVHHLEECTGKSEMKPSRNAPGPPGSARGSPPSPTQPAAWTLIARKESAAPGADVVIICRRLRGETPHATPTQAHGPSPRGGSKSSAMKLTVREAARLLAVSETEVYRWVDAGTSPLPGEPPAPLRPHRAARVGHLARLPVSPELFRGEERRPRWAPLARRSTAGASTGCRGRDPRARCCGRPSIAALAGRGRPRAAGRSAAGPRVGGIRPASGEGIAIPHVRSPVVCPGGAAAITLCFLTRLSTFGPSTASRCTRCSSS